MSGTAVMENPMLAQAVSSSRNAPTVPSLSRLVGQYTNNVSYPLLFVAGAALGILFASLVVLFSHSSKTHPEQKVAAFAVAAPAATWQPNVVIIHPAPADPPMFETPFVADPPALNAPAPPPAQVRGTTAGNGTKKTVARGQVRRQGKPGNGNLLAAAL